MAKESVRRLELLSLPDELLLAVTVFISPRDLLNLQCVSSRLRALETDKIWRQLCRKRWENWPRYRLTSSRLQWMDSNLPSSSWKERYLWAEKDFSRIRITEEEVEDLDWYLNFTSLAGGRGEDSVTWCKFHQGFLLVPNYMPLPYEIKDENCPTPCTRFGEREPVKKSNEQWVSIANFPPHNLSRSKVDGEWIITNENVTIVSIAEKSVSSHSSSILVGTG